MDYGKILKLTFDGKVYNVSSLEKTRYRLVNAYGEYIYPVNVTYGQSDHEVYLHFQNINNLVFPAYLECLQALKMGSEYISFGAFVQEVFLNNLHPIPGDFSYLDVAAVELTGSIELEVIFDGKAYFNEYLGIAATEVSGTNILLTFYKRYLEEDTYLNVATTVVSGQYCDINGNPL